MQKTLESVVPLIMCKIYSPGKTFFWLPSFSSVALPSLATLPSSWGSPLHRDDNDDEPSSGSSKTRMWQVWVLAGSWSSLLCPLSWWVYALCPGEFVPFVLVSGPSWCSACNYNALDFQILVLGLELPSLDWSGRLRLVGLAATTLFASNLGILALKVMAMMVLAVKVVAVMILALKVVAMGISRIAADSLGLVWSSLCF